jgi:hypothetical protein
LTGAPVVCTDVGASLRVLTDPEDGSCYSAVVAPNDALAMARAQIKILALLEEWAQYSDPEMGDNDSSFPDIPTPEDVARITQRMYDQTDARRKLGMKSREIVQKSFSGERYLREHEQMLWIGKAQKDMSRSTSSRPATFVPSPPPVYLSNITTAPVSHRRSQSRPLTLQEDSLPSLAFGNSSTMPSSIRTDLVPSTIGRVQLAEQEWVNRPGKPTEVGVRVVKMNPLRREMRTVSGVSSMTGEMMV